MKKIVPGILIAAAVWLPYSKLHAQAVCFQPSVGYLAGTGSKTVCAADFNGDGKPDLVLSNYTADLALLLNDGSGGFGAPSIVSTGVLPWMLCSSDFNGDGKADLAVHNSGPGIVNILLGSGTGTFTPGTDFSTGIYNTEASLCTGDFNADGKADLAIGSGFNYLFIALGNGNGSFAATVQYPTGGGRSIISGDINGDGKTDLATSLSVMFGNGNGTFAAPINLSTGVAPINITGADFNGDGKMDLAVSDINDNVSGNLSVVLGNAGGNFSAGTPVSIGANTVPSTLCTGDFNGDGKIDLATATVVDHSVGKVALLLGNGSGGFGAPDFFAVDSFPRAIVAADLNADGKTDLALATSKSNADTAGQANILLNCSTLGLNEFDNTGLQLAVYPNPSMGMFTVSCPQNMDRLTVVDVTGKVVSQLRPNTQQQTIQVTAKGIYFITVLAKQQTFLKKIVVAQ